MGHISKDFRRNQDKSLTLPFSKVSGVKEDDAWICSCFFLHRGQTHFMASYRRTGPRPLSASGFYSFVEDWDRCSGAEGHRLCRMAEFTEQQISVKVEGMMFGFIHRVQLLHLPCYDIVREKMSQISPSITKGRDTRLSDAVFTKASPFE